MRCPLIKQPKTPEGTLGGSQAVLAWSKDPQTFIREALGVSFLSRQQREACDAVRDLVWAKIKVGTGQKVTHAEQALSKKIGVSIMSGKGTGKDAITSMLIIWFLCCFPRPLIPCTAPTGHQLSDVLWSEINKWLSGTSGQDPPLVKNWLTWQKDKLFLTERKGRDWYALARTSSPKDSAEAQEETLQGFHEDYMMVVVDEASGVMEPVFRPLESTLTRLCNFILMIFNPTQSTGFAIESQRKERERWICLQWNAEDSELVTKDSIEDKENKYGRDSNYFRVNVLGLPPISGNDILIPYEWVIAAVDYDLKPLDDDPEVAGIDVGAGGDPTIYLRLRGPRVYPIEFNNSPLSLVVKDWCMGKIFRYEPKAAMVDNIGIGWGLTGELQKEFKGSGTTVVGVNVGLRMDDGRFFQLRDKLAWRVRERFEAGTLSIPNDPLLIGECTTIKYVDNWAGKLTKVESKKDMLKRGLMSPNRFDALCMAQYYETDRMREWSRKTKGKIKPPRNKSSWRTV